MSKIITQEIYEKELAQINPTIRIRGQYTCARDAVEHECLVCGFVWNVKPNNIKNGHGCPICANERRKSLKVTTHEAFVQKYQSRFSPTVEIVGKYSGIHEKIECKCLICGSTFYSKAHVIANGASHKTCSMKARGKILAKKHEEFVRELSSINSNITLLSEYKNSRTKIKCFCIVCKNEWDTLPGNILRRGTCPKCSIKQRTQNQTISHEEYVLRLAKVNEDIVVLEQYQGMNKKILHRCLRHMVDWKITPSNVLQGCGCRECLPEKISAKLLSMTPEEYVKKLFLVNPNVTPLEDFKGVGVKIKHKYETCGHVSDALPYLLLRGHGCNICAKMKAGKHFQKTHAQYIERLSTINPYIEPLEEYIGAQIKIKHRCKIDGYEWFVAPTTTLSGHGCPICNTSHGERKIANYLNSQGIKFIAQYSFDNLNGVRGGLLSYDFYLPQYNLLIEYQGEQHYRPAFGERRFAIQQEHDRRKKNYAQVHGYNFLEISFDDYENIEQILKDNLNLLSVETTGIAQ